MNLQKILLILKQVIEVVKQNKREIVVFAVILLMVATTFVFFVKQVHVMHSLSRKIASLEKSKRLNAVLDSLAKELPENEDITPLIGKLVALAKNKHLKEISITPFPVIKGDIYNEIPMEIKAKAVYHEVAVFFNEVEKLNTLVNIKEIYFSQLEPDISSVVRLQIKASTYTVGKKR